MSDLSHGIVGTTTGTGNLVRATSPTLTTPILGVATATYLTLTSGVLTAGTMTQSVSSLAQSTVHRFDWTNAMIVALGANLTGDITVCTLPAKTVVKRVWAVITGQAAGPTTLTMAIGRTGALCIDYLIAVTIKAAANTIYGAVAGDLGTNLTGYDLPSYTGTTAVKAHFIATVSNLDQTTGSSGSIYIETMVLP